MLLLLYANEKSIYSRPPSNEHLRKFCLSPFYDVMKLGEVPSCVSIFITTIHVTFVGTALPLPPSMLEKTGNDTTPWLLARQ